MRSVCVVVLAVALGVALDLVSACAAKEETCACFESRDGGFVTPSAPPPSPSGSAISLQPGDAASSPAACSFGAGAPVGLATNLVHPYALFVRAGTLYVTDPGAGKVESTATTGGPLTVLADTHGTLAGLAVDDHAVYFASTLGLSSVPLGGGAVTSLATDVLATGAVAVNAGAAYFVAAVPGSDGASAVVESVPLAGGALTPVGPASEGAAGLATGPDSVFWTSAVFGADGGVAGAVQRVSADGGAQTLAAGPFVPLAIALGGSDVFYSAYPAGSLPSISRVSVDGGPSTALTLGGSNPLALTVDDENVYWVDFDAGTVNCVPRSGGATTVLASEQGRPVAIAVDAAGLYWITQPPGPDAFGQLMRLAR